MLILSQSLVESGLTGLKPYGFFSYEMSVGQNGWQESGALDALKKEIEEKHPHIEYLLKARIDRWREGHPDNNYWYARLNGDAYTSVEE